jgi:hypothetical protein
MGPELPKEATSGVNTKLLKSKLPAVQPSGLKLTALKTGTHGTTAAIATEVSPTNIEVKKNFFIALLPPKIKLTAFG